MIADLLKSTVGTVLERVLPDKNARAEARERLAEMDLGAESKLIEGQLAINRQEAAHKSIFVAGARPFILWVCGVGLAYNTILQPILSIWLETPAVNTEALYPVLMGVLGLGGMRSFEKMKGVSRER